MARKSDPKQTDQNAVAVEEQPAAASVNPLAGDPELLNDFILESKEHLTSIELQLLTLDQDPGNGEAIHAIFRGFHTIKGMAGFLDLDAIREVA
jgi:two-component system chemotaxis sensor kinase CheA